MRNEQWAQRVAARQQAIEEGGAAFAQVLIDQGIAQGADTTEPPGAPAEPEGARAPRPNPAQGTSGGTPALDAATAFDQELRRQLHW